MLSLVVRSNISCGVGKFYLQAPRKFYSSTFKTYEQFSYLNKDLEKKAMDLIFGNKSYQNFKPEEKKLVDWYQDMMVKEDGGIILPNTKVDWEQRQVEQLYTRKNE